MGDYRPARWGNAREPYQFTGKEEDIEVGATYFGARYYQAHLGRFMSADPLAIHALGGDLNPYAYVRGRIMASTDPTGLVDDAVNAAAQQMPSPQPGTVTDPNGTTTTTSGPLGLALDYAAIIADQFGKIESTRIGVEGGPYFTPGDVHKEVANAVATLPANLAIAAADPIGVWRLVASLTGHPIGVRVIPASKDPKNVSGAMVATAGLVLAVAGVKSAAAAEAAAQPSLGPVAGGGAEVSNITAAEAARIQNAATRIGKPITLVGSRARGTATAASDWDYFVEANSATRRSVARSLPGSRNIAVGENGFLQLDIFKGPLDPARPHIIFSPGGSP